MQWWVGGWPPIDPDMSGWQVVLRPPGFAPDDSTERFSRSQTGRNSTSAGLCLSWPNLSEASRPLLRHRNYSKLPLHLKNKRQMTVDKKVIHTKAVPSRGKYDCGEAAVCRAGLFCSRPAFAPGIYFQQMAHDISQAVFPQIQMSFSQHSIIVSFSYSPTRILLYHCTAK